MPGSGGTFVPFDVPLAQIFVMCVRKRGTMALLVLQTKDVPMNAPVAKTCRQRRLFARFASVCALVALALLLLPTAALTLA